MREVPARIVQPGESSRSHDAARVRAPVRLLGSLVEYLKLIAMASFMIRLYLLLNSYV